MKKMNLLALFAAAGVALSATLATPSFAEPPKDKTEARQDEGKKAHKDKGDKKAAKLEIGQAAPDFTLTDTDGNTVRLADHKGKIVVLEWFNAECPFIVKHHKTNTTFNDLHKDFASKDVVFLAICSSAKGAQGSGTEFNKEKKAEFNMPYPILMDESGAVGKAYGAKTTPHCFIINKDGALAYNGAIDNDRSQKLGTKNYVRQALEQLTRGETVTEPKTDPYGCGVKYASKG